MKDSKLISILKTFSKDEFKEFEKFINSSFFSTGRNLKPLYTALKKFYPAFEGKNFTRENVFVAMFADKPYNDILMRRHTSDMIKMAENFMAVSGLMKDKKTLRLSLLKELRERKIYSLFEKEYENTLSSMNQTGFDSENLYFESKLVSQKQFYHLDKNELKEYFPIFCEICDVQFLIALIGIYKGKAAFLTFKQNYNYDPSHSLTHYIPDMINYDGLLELIKEKYPEYFPCFEIYYLIFKAGIEPNNINNIEILREKFFKIIDKFSHQEKFNIFRFIESFYILLRNRSSLDLIYQKATLNKEILQHNIYSFNPADDFSERAFHNFLTSFLNAKDIKYAEEFVEKYLDKLPKAVSKNMYNFSKALINWHMKNYELALEYLSNVISEQIHFIRNDIYYMKTILFFELNHLETCIYSIDTHNHYLRNNKENSEIVKQKFINFNQKLKKLINIKSGALKADIDELTYEINKTVPIHKPEWLIEKANELK